MKNKMNLALQVKRVCAFVIDFLIFISVFAVLQNLFNAVHPGNYIPPKGMQLFTARQLQVFFITIASAFAMFIAYLFICYRSQSGQTIGHRLFGIQLVTVEGERLSFPRQIGVIALAAVRFLVLFIPGPMVAVYGGSLAFSVFVLLWGVLLILPIPFQSRQGKVTLWQHLGGYRFKNLRV